MKKYVKASDDAYLDLKSEVMDTVASMVTEFEGNIAAKVSSRVADYHMVYCPEDDNPFNPDQRRIDHASGKYIEALTDFLLSNYHKE